MTTMKKTLMLTCFLVVFGHYMSMVGGQEVENQREFSYARGSSKDPEHWGDIKEDWSTCKTGQMQSPIDLRRRIVEVIPRLENLISFFYNPGNATIKNRGHDIAVIWNGSGGKIQINGTDYILRQCHWHTPAEHTISGQRFDMELHLVHENPNPGATNPIAVIGILYRLGKPDDFLAKLTNLIKMIPETPEEKIEAGIVDPYDTRPKDGREFFRYMGSLTVPPCTEGVIWTVNTKIRTVSREQINILREAVHDNSQDNARPLQPINGRPVRLFRLPRA